MLEVKSLAKTYGVGRRQTTALADVSFVVSDREFVCVVGPSGAGKTTLLKCMSGLLKPSGGEVWVDGKAVTGPPPEMALVFQEYSRSLYPWMTVADNIRMPLRKKKLGKERERRLVEESAAAVGLHDFTGHYPWELSGGMQQRVAIARALAYQPKILLMDEPFASIDAQVRADLEDLILEIRATYAMTVVFVTHDIDESVYLADRIVILTQRPTVVQEIQTVDLPSDRDQIGTKELPRYAELRAHVFTAIKRKQERDLAPASPNVATRARQPRSGSTL